MPHHHTELIRLLEQRNHIFPSDPASITEILRQADGTPEAKLHRRAQLIDRDQTIAVSPNINAACALPSASPAAHGLPLGYWAPTS